MMQFVHCALEDLKITVSDFISGSVGLYSCYKRLLLLLVYPSVREIREKCQIASLIMNVRARVLERSFRICRVRWCVAMTLALLKCISKSCKVNINVEDFKKKLKSVVPEFNNQEIGTEF